MIRQRRHGLQVDVQRLPIAGGELVVVVIELASRAFTWSARIESAGWPTIVHDPRDEPAVVQPNRSTAVEAAILWARGKCRRSPRLVGDLQRHFDAWR